MSAVKLKETTGGKVVMRCSLVRLLPTFLSELLAPSSGLNVEAAHSFDALATIYQIIRRHMPESSNICVITANFLEYGGYDEFNAIWLLSVSGTLRNSEFCAHCIYVFYMILRIEGNYFPKQY